MLVASFDRRSKVYEDNLGLVSVIANEDVFRSYITVYNSKVVNS